MSVKKQHIKLGEWCLDPDTGKLSRQKESEFLDHTPLQLLLCLIAHPGQDVSKEQLLRHGWKDKVVGEEVLTVAVSQIRKVLGDNARRPDYIKTIPGTGYRLLIQPEFINQEMASSPGIKSKRVFLAVTLLLAITTTLLVDNFTTQAPQTLVLSSLPEDTQDKFRQARYLATQHTPESGQKAQQLLQQVIAQAPAFSPAYLELVKSKMNLLAPNQTLTTSQITELYVLLDNAIEHNSQLAAAYYLYARLAFLHEMNIHKAKEYFLQALDKNPDHAHSHYLIAQLYLATGEFERALGHTHRYIDLSPEAYEIPTVAWIFNMMGNYPQAMQELAKLKALQPDSWVYSVSAQSILENMARHADSFKALQDVFSHAGFSQEEQQVAAQHFQQSGLTGVNAWLLAQQETRNIGQYAPPLAFARFAAKSGNIDLARRYLLQAYEAKQVELLWLKVDPKYESLRETSEFQQIVTALEL